MDSSLRRLVIRAAGWALGGHLASNILRFANSLILTRLIAPEFFGVMAVVNVVLVVAALLSDVGLRQAIIQSPRGDSQDLLNTAWTLQVIRGVLIWLACSAVGLGLHVASQHGMVPKDSVYGTDILFPVLATTAFSAVITGFQSTKLITRDRDLDLRQIIYIEIVSQAAGLAVMIALGFLTHSVWSFVAGAMVSALLGTILSHRWLQGASNRLRLDRQSAGELMRFGRWIVVSSSFSVLGGNGDRLLLGAWLSPAVLGIYSLAFNLVAIVDSIGGRLFWSVASPAFSKIVREQPDRLRASYYKFRLPFDMLFVGSAGLLYGAGRAIIDLLYDPRYAAAGHMLQVLSFSLLIGRYGVAPTVYVALGVPKYLTIVNFVNAASIFVLVPAAYWAFGFEGALWAIALRSLPSLPVIFALNRAYGLNRPFYELATLLFWPVGYGAGLAISRILAWL